MADFKAPTPEELASFVPPTEEEEAEFAPPNRHELKRFKDRPDDVEDDEMGAAEAFGRSAIASTTLGASDIVGGVGGAIGQAIADPMIHDKAPSLESMLQGYREGKAREVASREKAMEDQPTAAITGMVTGGLASPVPGAILAKTGKIGRGVAKVLPSFKGAEKIAKTGNVAQKAKDLGKIELYNKLKKAQRAKSMAMASREGLKGGAITGVTMGDSELLTGDVKGTVRDAIVGGTLGAAAAAGLVGGTHVTQKVIMSIPGMQSAVDSFTMGMKGLSLDDKVVNSKISTAAKKYISQIENRLNTFGKEKKKILDMIDDAGITINTKSDLQEARKLVNSIDSPTERQKAQQFLDVIEDYLGDGKATRAAVKKLQNEITKSKVKDPYAVAQSKLEQKALKKSIESSGDELTEEVSKGAASAQGTFPEGSPGVRAAVREEKFTKLDPKTGELIEDVSIKAQPYTKSMPSKIKRQIDPDTGRQVLSTQDLSSGQVKAIVTDVPSSLDAENLTTTQVDRLRGLLKNYSAIAKKDNLPKEVIQAATRAEQALKDKISGASSQIKQPLDEVNKKLTSLMNAKELSGLKKKSYTVVDKKKDLQSMAQFISGVTDKNPVSDKSLVMQQLRKADPKLAKEISKEVEELRRMHELSQPVDHVPHSASFRALMGTAESIVNKISNTLGQAAGAPKRMLSERIPGQKALAAKTLEMVQSSPDQIQGLINTLQSAGGKTNQMFIAPLKKALASPPKTRTAIMYGLMSQPAFREMLESEQPTEGKEK